MGSEAFPFHKEMGTNPHLEEIGTQLFPIQQRETLPSNPMEWSKG